MNLGVSRLRQSTRYPDSQEQPDTSRTSDARYATLTWRLLDFGQRDANRRSADAALEAAISSHDAALQNTMGKVIGLYFDAQTANAALAAKSRSEALARQTLETAQKRESRGASAESDTLQARTSLAKAELDRTRALGAYEKTLVALIVAIGLPAGVADIPRLMLAEDFQAPEEPIISEDLASWLEQARQDHPAIVAARAQLRALREKLDATQSEGLPTLDFTASRYVNGYPGQGLGATRSTQNVVGLQVNIPLFDGFRHTYEVRSVQAQIEIRKAELRDTQAQVLGEVAKAYSDAIAALRNLASSQRLRSAAQEALANVQRKYDRGVSDILEMLNVQAALADAEQERIRALAEWRSARLRLLANVGGVGTHDLRP